MNKETNPKGRPRRDQPLLREKHLRFIAAACANTYTPTECLRMLNEEFGMNISSSAVEKYYKLLRNHAPDVDATLKVEGEYGIVAIEKALSLIKPLSRGRLASLFDEYFKERRKISEDPTYGILYADKRRRIMKLSQNVGELDAPKVFAKGSFPTRRNPDGSMDFEKFEIANKDHGEQRKTLDAIGTLVDGAGQGGDVVIQIVDNASPEEEKSSAELTGEKKMRELREKKDANKPPTFNPKEQRDE